MKRIVLIDGDIELFRISQQCEIEVDWGDIVTMSTDIEHAKSTLDMSVSGIVEKLGADDYILCISGKNNFRKVHHPTYKSNRSGKKPMGYQKLRDYAIENFKSKVVDALEADDTMGILATKGAKDKEYVIYSIDKDMHTIPAKVWNQDDEKDEVIQAKTADRNLYTQILTGDVVDGYKGCPKVGKVKAQRALSTCSTSQEMLNETYKLFCKAYDTEEEAKAELINQAQQARILRHSDWDKKEGTVKLWNPFEGA